MADAGGLGGDGDGDGAELLLLPESGERKLPWRLNFEGFRRSEPAHEKRARGLHYCLGVVGLNLAVSSGIRRQSSLSIHRMISYSNMILQRVYLCCF